MRAVLWRLTANILIEQSQEVNSLNGELNQSSFHYYLLDLLVGRVAGGLHLIVIATEDFPNQVLEGMQDLVKIALLEVLAEGLVELRIASLRSSVVTFETGLGSDHLAELGDALSSRKNMHYVFELFGRELVNLKTVFSHVLHQLQ